MRCKNCGYRLWNIPSRTCPECGAGFLPSEFEFTVNSVQFCCPHCNSVYYGTSDEGHLVPVEFECTGCRRRIHMDDTILLPTAGVEEQRTQVDRVPWLERKERGFFRAWLATIGMALVRPGRLMRAVPDARTVGAAWGFAILTNTLSLLMGIVFFSILSMFFVISSGGAPAPGGILFAVLIQLGIMTVGVVAFTLIAISLWGLVSHGLLRVTGTTRGPLRRTYEALCYSTGANVGTAIPCLGFYFGWIWWLVSAVIMVKVAQKVQGWRAALAVLLLPGISMAVIGGLYAWLLYTVMGASGGWAMIDAEHRTNVVTGALIAYAQAHSGQGPSHAFTLIADGYVQPGDLVSTMYITTTTPGGLKTTAPSPTEFATMSPPKQKAATDAAVAALPGGVTAHRLGEFVFVHHGIDFNTCDAQLWIVIWSPDPSDPTTQTSGERIVIGYCDGTVEAVDGVDFDAALAEQNDVRTENVLSPLSDPRNVKQKQNDTVP